MNTGRASALYVGNVAHQRFRPRAHKLSYRLYTMLLDLDELDAIDRRLRLFSIDGGNLFSFFGKDRGAKNAHVLKAQIEGMLADAGLAPDGGAIRLLTMPRVCGWAFNPLSVFFCHRRSGELCAILWQVDNTFGQRHGYLIPVASGSGEPIRQSCDKAFYVSPFLDMKLRYDFRVAPPVETLAVVIDASDADGIVLRAQQTGRRVELTDANLLKAFFALPLLTLRVVAGIHWEALKIWLKGVALRDRPPPPAEPISIVKSVSRDTEFHPLMTPQASPLLDAATFRRPTRSVSGGVKARLLLKFLPRLQHGRLSVKTPDGDVVETVGAEAEPEAKIRLRRWRALRRMAFGGDIGAAESYIDGDWTSPNLTACIALAARNRDALARELRGSVVVEWIERARNRLRTNSLRGSRRNVMSHYDLGNDFFRLWLDQSMVYSSALWDRDGLDLDAAQRRKFERIADCLRLTGGESVLEIGFGWGGLALHLAEGFGAKVTGLTLSPSQLAFAKDLASRRALEAQIDLRLQDYRRVEGQFDRIVSIEMFEAVGESYWPTYFETIRRCLKPGGVAVLQVITIAEDRYDSYRSDPDFIQKYVFPGGFLPSKTALAGAVRQAGLAMTSSQAFGLSYARTLAEWRRRFHARWPEIATLGFDRRFRRLWDYYLSYCEAGFAEGAIDVGFYVIEHDPAPRRLDPLRDSPPNETLT